MELKLTPEQEAQLRRIADREGTTPEGLLLDTVIKLIERDQQFHAALQQHLPRKSGGPA